MGQAALTPRVDYVVAYTEITNNITLSGSQTVDGVVQAALLPDPTVVLLTAQTDTTANGLWEVRATAWTRPRYWETSGQLRIGQRFTAMLGTQKQVPYSLYTHVFAGDPRPVLGTTHLLFRKDGPTLLRDHELPMQRDSRALVFEDDFIGSGYPETHHFLPGAIGTGVSGVWTPTQATLVPILTRTAGAADELAIYPIPSFPSKVAGDPSQPYITSIQMAYSVGTADADDVRVEIVQMDFTADNAIPTAAIVAGATDAEYDGAHANAAARGDDTTAPEEHVMTMTPAVPTPVVQGATAIGQYIQVAAECAGAAGSVVIVKGLDVVMTDLGVQPPWGVTRVMTAGVPVIAHMTGADADGGWIQLAADATVEIQQLALTHNDHETIVPTAGFVGEIGCRFNPSAALPAAGTVFAVGFATAYAADITTTLRHIFVRITGADLSLIVDNDDGTIDQSVDSTVDAVVATDYRFRFDLTDTANVTVYYAAAGGNWAVLRTGIVMSALAATDLMQPMCVMQKGAVANTESLEIDYVKYWVERS